MGVLRGRRTRPPRSHYQQRRDHGDRHAAALRNLFTPMLGQLYHCPHARQHYDLVKTIAPHVAAAASGSKCKLVHLGVGEASQHALELRDGQPISLAHPR